MTMDNSDIPSTDVENVDLFKTEIDPSEASFFYEDLTEDDEVWLLQCPKSIDPNSLVGSKIDFVEKKKVKCKRTNSIKRRLESYPIPYEPGTSKINILLPSVASKTLRINVSDIAGKIILTEPMTVPKIDYDALMAENEEEAVPFPTDLKLRHPFLDLDNPEETICQSKSKKKKKKRKRKLDASTSSLDDFESVEIKVEPTDPSVENFDSSISSPKKKKRKYHM